MYKQFSRDLTFAIVINVTFSSAISASFVYLTNNTLPSDKAEEWINIVVCIKNVAQSNHRLGRLAGMLDSVLRGARHRPMRWLLLTVPKEIANIHYLLLKIVKAKAKVPVQVVYLNVGKIAEPFSSQINMTRTNLLCTDPLESSRFWDEVSHPAINIFIDELENLTL